MSQTQKLDWETFGINKTDRNFPLHGPVLEKSKFKVLPYQDMAMNGEYKDTENCYKHKLKGENNRGK